MFKRSLSVAMALMFIVALVPFQGLAFAADGDVTLTSLMQGDMEPVTLYLRDWNNLPSIDPQVTTDSVSIDYVEGLFLGLTNNNTETAEIEPEMATEWSYDADTLTWTFTIRDDVPWVRWDPMTQESTVLRNVVAGDFVTGIRRACDPNVAGFYGDVVGANIAGCADVRTTAPEDVTPEMLEGVGVAAPDDTTLTITLSGNRGYFFSMVGMWVLRAVPGEVIEEFGDEWTEPGNLVSNGPFFMDEWVRGVRRVMVRNPHVPADLAGPGNV
jgi:oligopeptide transport system substrate-binding protein